MNTVEFFSLYLELCSSAEVQLLQPCMVETSVHVGSVSKGLVCNPCVVSLVKICILGMLEFI